MIICQLKRSYSLLYVELWNCGIVELLNRVTVELWNRGAWLCLCLCLLPPGTRNPKPETDEKPYNLLILTKKKSTSLLS